jgi:hypothetical protein
MMTELKSAVNMWEPRAQDSQPIEEASMVNPIPSGLDRRPLASLADVIAGEEATSGFNKS